MEDLVSFKKFGFFALLFLVLVFTSSCRQTEELSSTQTLGDGKYDSSSSGSFSKSIESIAASVKKIDVVAFYRTWSFPQNSEYSNKFIKKSNIEEVSTTSVVSNQSVTGTALIVYSHDFLTGFLSCAHIVDYPDTVFTYYDDDKTMVKTVSHKIRQQIYIAGMSGGSKLEIVAFDAEKDLVLLKKVLEFGNNDVMPIDIKVGSTRKLEWGSEIIVLGYPLGNLMLTKGIVSIDGNTKKRIISDALYNKGISGSPVFAMLDGSNNLEWVGMASSASSQAVRFLKPDENGNESFENKSVYYGDVFINERHLINYGVTYSIPIEEILNFMTRNKSKIIKAGFKTDLFSTNNKD